MGSDRVSVADFVFVSSLHLANFVIQQRLIAIPARIGIVNVEDTARNLVRPYVVVQFGQSLMAAVNGRHRVKKLSGWIRGCRNLLEDGSGQRRHQVRRNLVAEESLVCSWVNDRSGRTGEITLPLCRSGYKGRVSVGHIVGRGSL